MYIIVYYTYILNLIYTELVKRKYIYLLELDTQYICNSTHLISGVGGKKQSHIKNLEFNRFVILLISN